MHKRKRKSTAINLREESIQHTPINRSNKIKKVMNKIWAALDVKQFHK